MAGAEERFQRTRDTLAGHAPEGEPEPIPSLTGAADRIREMLVTAEDVSEDIRREATAEAERYLSQRRREADAFVSERREHLERALEVLRTEGREIERRLRAVTEALEQALGDPLVSDEAPASQPQPVAEPQADEPEPPPPIATEEEPTRASGDDAHDRQRALIRATQLAVQGADRTVVLQTLEREFGLDDTAAIVEEILGAE